MKTIDIKSNSRILHWAFYIFLFTVLSVGSVYASEDTPSVLINVLIESDGDRLW